MIRTYQSTGFQQDDKDNKTTSEEILEEEQEAWERVKTAGYE